MSEVKCDHCGAKIRIEDAIPCTWEEIGSTWFYCKRCEEGVFGGKIKVKNNKVINALKDRNESKSFSMK
jgi:hypothetical protein